MNSIYYDAHQQKLRKTFIIAIVTISFLAIIIILYQFVQTFGRTSVTISPIPKDAQVFINDKKNKPGGHYLKPGTYKIFVTKTGFGDWSDTIEVKKSAVELHMALTPITDDAIEWAETNRQAYLDVEEKVGARTNQEGEEFRKANPIVTKLPFKNLLFRIDYGVSEVDSSRVKVYITASNSLDRSYALKQIKDWGYNPGDYEIVFKDFINPLENR